jgi:undecaprenyl-diphosphatase
VGFISYLILGLLQGVTEFLPISSSGHLLIFSKYFGIEESLFVSIVLHFATLLSICVVMRKELWRLIKKPFSKQTLNLFLSTIITLMIALLLYNFAKQTYLDNFVSFGFMITAVILIITDIFSKDRQKELNKKHSLIMGIAQGLALFPGISRSGSTICSGILSGANQNEVTNHSFLMSLPIIIASLFMELLELKSEIINIDILPLSLGFVVAFISGVVALKFMLKHTQKIKLRYFAYYLIVISLISLFV